jgi:site-specific DNA-cytosine methylase
MIVDRIEKAGYNLEIKVLDTRNFWLPQIRTRIFLVWTKKKTFKFPEGKKLEVTIEEFFKNEVDEKYYLDETQIEEAKEKRKGKTFASGITNGSMKLTRNELGYILALTKVNFWKTNRQTNLIRDKKGIRILTGQEHEKAQGFPEGWASDILPEYLVKEVTGNAISIPVVKEIFKELYKFDF